MRLGGEWWEAAVGLWKGLWMGVFGGVVVVCGADVFGRGLIVCGDVLCEG